MSGRGRTPSHAAWAARNALRAATVGSATLLLAGLAAGAGAAQTLAERVAGTPDGVIRFHFQAAAGVFGAGDDVIIVRRNGRVSIMHGDGRHVFDSPVQGDACDCDTGPVHIGLRKSDGRIASLAVAVGETGPAVRGAETDLGEVQPQEAADYLLGLAADSRERVAKDAIRAATLGRDVTLWRGLARLARDRGVIGDVRENAVFWLGQEAAAEALGELEGLALDDDEEMEIRKRAIFSLSQHEATDPVPTLLEIAGSERLDPRLRRHAMFWLAQHDDERVIDFFEAIFRGG